MISVEASRTRWISERPSHAHFADAMAFRLRQLTSSLGIAAQVSARPKEVHSLVKKLLAKSHLTYENMPDKVGARIIVRYLSELPRVLASVKSALIVGKIEDTSERLSIDRVGYQGIHVDGVAFPADDSLQETFPFKNYFLELQLRTMSQHLWSEISHDSFYKSDVLIRQLPTDLRRRVHLMAGQVEIADREFGRMNSEIPVDPAVQLFQSLEPLYYTLSAEIPNVELSMEVIRTLLPLYGHKRVDEVSALISSRFNNDLAMLRYVYAKPENTTTEAAAFLFQPEALMIYDCLLSDRDQTLKSWNTKFPSEELERVATVLGISLE